MPLCLLIPAIDDEQIGPLLAYQLGDAPADAFMRFEVEVAVGSFDLPEKLFIVRLPGLDRHREAGDSPSCAGVSAPPGTAHRPQAPKSQATRMKVASVMVS